MKRKKRTSKELKFVRNATALTVATALGTGVAHSVGGTVGSTTNISGATRMMGVIPTAYVGSGLIGMVGSMGSTPRVRRRKKK